MLNLQASIHFQEIKLTGLIEQKLNRARTDVVDGFCRINGGATHCLTKFRCHHRARRFLNHLLVTALNGAIALTEIYGIACFVSKHLYLDVARSNHGFLDDQLARAKGIFGFRLREINRGFELSRIIDESHAPAATTGRRLYHHGHANRVCFRNERLDRLIITLITGNTRYTRLDHRSLCSRLVTHHFDSSVWWTDKLNTARFASRGKRLVL